MVRIPGGTLHMGSDMPEITACAAFWGERLVDATYDVERFRHWLMKEYPRHPVEVAPFSIGRYPVTNGEYRRFIGERGHQPPESLLRDDPADHPVWGVSHDEAVAYAAWFGARHGCEGRLPGEAEWEWAARGPSGREYPFGDQFDASRCNTLEAGIGRTTPVDRYPPSEFGVFDLAGNVEEWTADVYAPYPGGRYIEDDLSLRLGRRYRVLRGGSFARGGDLARCARRHGPFPAPEFRFVGFRVVIHEDPP